MINIYEDSPTFVSGVEFSGIDGNVLRNNAIFLDALVQQPISVFTQGVYSEAREFMGRNKITHIMPRAWWGAFQYRTGMTSAVYALDGTRFSTERARIYHKPVETTVTDENAPGTLVYDQLWPNAPTPVIIDITSAGYTDGQIIEVVVQVYLASDAKGGVHTVSNAFTSPVSSITALGSYPGLPTFGSLTAANLNQLANTQDWIMNRLAALPRVPFISGLFVNGTHKSGLTHPNNPHTLLMGSINKGNGQDTFVGVIDYYAFNGQEVIRVYVGGFLMYTSAVLTAGQSGTLEFSFDISAFADGNDYDVQVEQYVTPGQGQQELAIYGDTIIDSRYSIRKLEATDTRSYYTPATEFGILESMTFATLKSRLNNIKTGTLNAYNAIIGSTVFDRARMFRKKVGIDDHQNDSLDIFSLPVMQARIGERYVVAGKDVKICWGGYTLKKPLLEDYLTKDLYEFANEETLIGTDKVEVKEGYFEEFEGLFVGVTYYIKGKELAFFSEYLR